MGNRRDKGPKRMDYREYRAARWKNEREYEAHLISVARQNGWLVSSMHDSRAQMWNTDAGIPDLIMAKSHPYPRLVFAELKMPGNGPTDLQKKWLGVLQTVARFVPRVMGVYLWYPEDEPEAKKILEG